MIIWFFKNYFTAGYVFHKLDIWKDFLKFQNKKTDGDITKHNIAFL